MDQIAFLNQWVVGTELLPPECIQNDWRNGVWIPRPPPRAGIALCTFSTSFCQCSKWHLPSFLIGGCWISCRLWALFFPCLHRQTGDSWNSLPSKHLGSKFSSWFSLCSHRDFLEMKCPHPMSSFFMAFSCHKYELIVAWVLATLLCFLFFN